MSDHLYRRRSRAAYQPYGPVVHRPPTELAHASEGMMNLIVRWHVWLPAFTSYGFCMGRDSASVPTPLESYRLPPQYVTRLVRGRLILASVYNAPIADQVVLESPLVEANEGFMNLIMRRHTAVAALTAYGFSVGREQNTPPPPSGRQPIRIVRSYLDA
jgi:hypothetical protein